MSPGGQFSLSPDSGAEGDFRCVYVNVETAQAAREDVGAAMRAVLVALARQERITLRASHLQAVWREALADAGPHEALQEALGRWAEADPSPLVLLIDEIDTLIGDTLLAVLRQLRAGYPNRPRHYPQSVVLCGIRDVRDYRIRSSAENPNQADAICDRLLHDAHRIELKGRSMRRTHDAPKTRNRKKT